jgi:hypothetical protein
MPHPRLVAARVGAAPAAAAATAGVPRNLLLCARRARVAGTPAALAAVAAAASAPAAASAAAAPIGEPPLDAAAALSATAA